ncbi:MAG: hypothetical protein AB1Z29_01370 [Desulfobacterales bacterium]|jgi:hypothetical protein
MHEEKSGPARNTSQLIGLYLGPALFYIIGTAIFSVDPGVFPEWAAQMGTGAHN